MDGARRVKSIPARTGGCCCVSMMQKCGTAALVGGRSAFGEEADYTVQNSSVVGTYLTVSSGRKGWDHSAK